MPISFGKKSKSVEIKLAESSILEALIMGADPLSLPLHPGDYLPARQARLVDLRPPETFGAGFIPGSYNLPDVACLLAARRTGLFIGRSIYLLADDMAQLELCSEGDLLGKGAEVVGWFGPDAIQEWQKINPQLGSIQAIDFEALALKHAVWNALVFDIECGEERRPLTNPGALRFRLEELPLSLDGLPEETPICLTSSRVGLSSFAASLLWNFGFQNVSYLSCGCGLPSALADES